MRAAGFATLLLGAAALGAAQAEAHEGGDWYRSARAWIETVLGTAHGDAEIITPPAGIDPKMVVVPPRPDGTLRVIPPPSRPGR